MKANLEEQAAPQVKARGMVAETWRVYKKSAGAMLGLILVLLVIVAGVLGGVLYDYDTDIVATHIAERLQPPSSEHWFGTDEYGRDIFARVIYATRYSLSIGMASVVVTCGVGVTLGALAGYYGGMTETAIMRGTDVIMAIPPILLGICLVTAFGQDMGMLTFAVALGGIPPMTRIARASVMMMRDQEFVESAKAVGANDAVIILRHVLPNAIAPIIVQATLRIGAAIIAIASLSFIGLGVSAPTPEWGSMLSGARTYIRGSGYMALFPGFAIMITVMGFNLLGDGIRDGMDPKLKR